jgi:hypothetical protein
LDLELESYRFSIIVLVEISVAVLTTIPALTTEIATAIPTAALATEVTAATAAGEAAATAATALGFDEVVHTVKTATVARPIGRSPFATLQPNRFLEVHRYVEIPGAFAEIARDRVRCARIIGNLRFQVGKRKSSGIRLA